MVPDPEFQTQTEPSDTSTSDAPARPARRSGRGRRGRGRRRKQKPPVQEAAQAEMPQAPPSDEVVGDQRDTSTEMAGAADAKETTEPVPAPAEPEPFNEGQGRPVSAQPPARPPHHAPRHTVQQAIDEVSQIMVSLKETQDLMEEVLEMLEEFERQGNADAREIDSLRRALRHLQRPREGAHPQRGRP